MTKYKSIDLFAGIGGIRLGFDQAFGQEIETVFVSEWDINAQKTYREIKQRTRNIGIPRRKWPAGRTRRV